ncbi:MAG: tetratricopeptide repeat protein [Oceanospirillaceae bacterium]|nr:tetratricopeptide repeat protein [Oceanospirillaceae bacterium]
MLTAPRCSFSVLLAILLSGCGSHSPHDEVPPPESPYCLRGGSGDSFSCDPDKQEPIDTDVREVRIDDADLQARLADIKQWLRSEKAAMKDNPGTTDESDIRLPPPRQQPETRSAETPAPPLPSLLPDARYRESLAEADRLQRQGYPEHARQLLKQLTREFPHRPEAYNNLGVLLAANGQYSAAVEQLRQALETHPHYARIHDNLRELYGAIAGNTYNDALGMRRVHVAPKLQPLAAAEDADDDDSIAALVGTRIEHWAEAPGYTPEQQAQLYIPGYRPDADTNHRQWLESLAADDRVMRLREYELAVMGPDWVEVLVTASHSGSGDVEQWALTLVRNGNRWLISSERRV